MLLSLFALCQSVNYTLPYGKKPKIKGFRNAMTTGYQKMNYPDQEFLLIAYYLNQKNVTLNYIK